MRWNLLPTRISENGVRKFARKIFLVHLALLAVVLGVVAIASRQIYHSARQQALVQARDRQSLLASQTARAIENFYEAILNDLELAKPADEDSGDPDPTSMPSDVPPGSEDDLLKTLGAEGGARSSAGGRGGANRRTVVAAIPPQAPLRPAGRGVPFARQLIRQLQNRSHLFLVERTRVLHAHTLGTDTNTEPTAFEADVLANLGPWLRGVKAPTVSELFKSSLEGVRLNLVATPIPGPRSMLLVAAVGVRPVEHEFLGQISQHGNIDAYLFDDSPQNANMVMAASQAGFAGNPLNPAGDARLNAAIDSLRLEGYRGTRELNHPFNIGGQENPPAMITVEPIRVLDRQWVLMVASPLSEVDAVMKDLFHKTVFWAAVVAIAMAGILVSTAIQLIRGRVRTERMRHELLQGELKQAREIQLAWLPDKTKSAAGGLDIASINRPASHISGDFYNFFELPDGRVAVVIGDVTGHGIAAAFLMATTQLLVRTTLPRVSGVGQCLEEVNRQLCIQVFNGQFVTMQILAIDPRSGEVEIGSAGHPPPLIDSAEGFSAMKLEPQLVLGVDRSAVYVSQRFILRPAGKLLLYTDGVVEAENAAGERLRTDGLRGQLASSYTSAQELIDAVLSTVNKFRGSRELKDDLTIVAVQLPPQKIAQLVEHPRMHATIFGAAPVFPAS
jgi:serine phosphatase RsbU (regulator of sigma subunit)